MTWSLRWHISFLFIFSLVLVTGLATALGVQQSRADLKESIVSQQQRAGEGAANGVNYFLDSSGRSLTSTAALIPDRDLRPEPNAAAIGALFDPLVAYSFEFDNVYLLDADANVDVVRPSTAGDLGFDAFPSFQKAREESRSVLSLDPQAGPLHWIVPVPASAGYDRRYFVLGTLDLNRIEQILFASLPGTGEATVVNDEGMVLASTDAELSQEAIQEWGPWPRVESARALSFEGKEPAGSEDVMVSVNALLSFPAKVILLSPTSQVTALQDEILQNALVTSLFLAALAILLGVFAASRITRPLTEVRSAAHRMTQGDLTVRARPQGPRELEELARDFNAMAASLAAEREQLLGLQRDLEGLVEQRTAEVHQKSDEMALFFYGVSHDFKSPVISISAFSQLAEEHLQHKRIDRDQLLALVGRIRAASGGLQTLTNELLHFARADRMSPTYERIGASGLIRAVADELGPLARERDVELELSGPELELTTDADRLHSIVTNLVQNAIKYMPSRANARVRVRWKKDGDRLVVHVEDNGAGIPADVQQRLFLPFSRHVPKGMSVAGTGLGLSIVRRLVDSLGGTIEVKSEVGTGTTFTVRLPLQPSRGTP